jgi:hypothetical protein
VQPLHAKELLALTLEPSWADLDPSGRRALAVFADSGASLSDAELLRVADWLRSQPIPVIGLSGAAEPALGKCVDVLVNSEPELARVLRRIDMNPNASAVLVQVLRAVGELSIKQGLMLESLAYATLQGGAEFAAWLSDYRARHSDRIAKAERHAPVLLERRDELLKLTLNSPGDRNALSCYMRDALTEAFKLVAMDARIARVTVVGNGPCFCAGGDLTEFGTADDLALSHRTRMLRMPAQYLARDAQRYTFHVHRACIGAGIEMPAFAGRITATSDTVFQLPEVAMGLIPGAGGCVSIPRRIGRQRTAYMAIMGEPIAAEVALGWGLIDAIED